MIAMIYRDRILWRREEGGGRGLSVNVSPCERSGVCLNLENVVCEKKQFCLHFQCFEPPIVGVAAYLHPPPCTHPSHLFSALHIDISTVNLDQTFQASWQDCNYWQWAICILHHNFFLLAWKRGLGVMRKQTRLTNRGLKICCWTTDLIVGRLTNPWLEFKNLDTFVTPLAHFVTMLKCYT